MMLSLLVIVRAFGSALLSTTGIEEAMRPTISVKL